MYEENQGAVRDTAQTVYDSYLQSNGQETGVESYNMVTGLLVAWHQEKYVIREDETEPTVFDPYNYDEVFPEARRKPPSRLHPQRRVNPWTPCWKP